MMRTIKELEKAGYTDERIKGYEMCKEDVVKLINELELKDVTGTPMKMVDIKKLIARIEGG